MAETVSEGSDRSSVQIPKGQNVSPSKPDGPQGLLADIAKGTQPRKVESQEKENTTPEKDSLAENIGRAINEKFNTVAPNTTETKNSDVEDDEW